MMCGWCFDTKSGRGRLDRVSPSASRRREGQLGRDIALATRIAHLAAGVRPREGAGTLLEVAGISAELLPFRPERPTFITPVFWRESCCFVAQPLAGPAVKTSSPARRRRVFPPRSIPKHLPADRSANAGLAVLAGFGR